MYWVPSNVGIPGNTAADHLAALAITARTVELDIELELEKVYSLADRYILDKWQSLWSNSTTGNHYRLIVSLVSTQVKYSHPARSQEVIIKRSRLGTCASNAHLHKMKRHADGLYTDCGQTEIINHYLFECPVGTVNKQVWIACTRLSITVNIETGLSNAINNEIILHID